MIDVKQQVKNLKIVVVRYNKKVSNKSANKNKPVAKNNIFLFLTNN